MKTQRCAISFRYSRRDGVCQLAARQDTKCFAALRTTECNRCHLLRCVLLLLEQFLRSLCAIQYRGWISWETFKFIINENYLSSLIKTVNRFSQRGAQIIVPSWNDGVYRFYHERIVCYYASVRYHNDVIFHGTKNIRVVVAEIKNCDLQRKTCSALTRLFIMDQNLLTDTSRIINLYI